VSYLLDVSKRRDGHLVGLRNCYIKSICWVFTGMRLIGWPNGISQPPNSAALMADSLPVWSGRHLFVAPFHCSCLLSFARFVIGSGHGATSCGYRVDAT
jgi:hypothetical protein